MINKIVKAVETTNLPLSRIAPFCGINNQTLRNWMRDGKLYQYQIDFGIIKKSDLSIKQKREVNLYQRVTVALENVKKYYLQKIKEIEEKKADAKAK